MNHKIALFEANEIRKTWDNLNNENFKRGEFATFKNKSGSNKFKVSLQMDKRKGN